MTMASAETHGVPGEDATRVRVQVNGDANTRLSSPAHRDGRPSGSRNLGRWPGFVRLGLELVGPIEVAAGRQEEHEPERHEDAQEGVQLGHARQEHREDGQTEADAVDREDGLPVREPEVQQPVMDVRAVGRERRAAVRDPADDDPERVDDRDAQHEQRDRDLGRPEDGEHGQGEADELDAAGPGEDRGGVEVPAQEPEQRPGQREAEHRDQRLAAADLVVRLMMPRVTAAMKATPEDRPSRPSIQLMLLIIPTIQKTVRPAATGRRSDRWKSGPERVGDEIDGDPERDGAAQASTT